MSLVDASSVSQFLHVLRFYSIMDISIAFDVVAAYSLYICCSLSTGVSL